ncbi:MAG: energy transducer TonB [Paludibacteraceae bacterium]
MVYPDKLKENNSEDNLKLLIQLNKDGKLVKSKVMNSGIPEMEKEVLRVTKLLPRLTTTNNKGKNVDISVELPISFRMLRL